MDIQYFGGSGRLVEFLLRFADVDHFGGFLQRELDHRKSDTAVAEREVGFDHLVRPPLVNDEARQLEVSDEEDGERKG